MWKPPIQCARIHLPLAPILQITKFMGPTWGPPGSCRPQMGSMLAPWTLQSGTISTISRVSRTKQMWWYNHFSTYKEPTNKWIWCCSVIRNGNNISMCSFSRGLMVLLRVVVTQWYLPAKQTLSEEFAHTVPNAIAKSLKHWILFLAGSLPNIFCSQHNVGNKPRWIDLETNTMTVGALHC